MSVQASLSSYQKVPIPSSDRLGKGKCTSREDPSSYLVAGS